MSDRLEQQLSFVVEIDRLKTILRQTMIADASRRENSAEHSWHLAVMAFVLEEYAPAGIDLPKVMKMVLIHDLVEIDPGDTFCYDAEAMVGKAEREAECAERVFGLLPEAQAAEVRALWDEFEARETPEARYANAIDRLQPILQNFHTGGGTWRMNGVHKAQVFQRAGAIRDTLPEVWPFVERTLAHAEAEGWLKA